MRAPNPARGFSLIEVMVAVLIIATGLLGIAKMQALALSDTGNSRTRALVAMEAAGLASVMQADRGYWTTKPVAGTDFIVSTANGVVTSSQDGVLATAIDCSPTGVAPCSAAQIAAYDLQNWTYALQGNPADSTKPPGIVPNATTDIHCTLPATTLIVVCTVAITWQENIVNSNSAQTASASTTVTALATPTYTIQVQP